MRATLEMRIRNKINIELAFIIQTKIRVSKYKKNKYFNSYTNYKIQI